MGRLGSCQEVPPEPVEINHARAKLLFRTVADWSQMIDDASVSVLVDFDATAKGLLGQLQAQLDARGIPGTGLLRELQPYAETLPARVTAEPWWAGYLEEVAPRLRVWRGSYDELVGIDLSTTNDTVG